MSRSRLAPGRGVATPQGEVCVKFDNTQCYCAQGFLWSDRSIPVLSLRKSAKRSRVALTQAFVLAVAGVIAIPASPPVEAASEISNTYNYTGSTQTFTVPDGVTSIEVTLQGGQGGRGGGDSQGSPTPGGYQGVVTGTIAVTPGQELTVAVGGGGGTGASSVTDSGGGSAGLNPLSGYDGARGGNAGNAGSSGAGGGSGAATVLLVDGTPIVAGGAGGNGGNGQFFPIVGRRAESTHTARPDTVSTTGRPGWNTADASPSHPAPVAAVRSAATAAPSSTAEPPRPNTSVSVDSPEPTRRQVWPV